jgi:hypothetical protein
MEGMLSNESFDIRLCHKMKSKVENIDESAQMFTNIISEKEQRPKTT